MAPPAAIRLAAPAAAQTQVSLEMIIDGATGVRVGIPVRMLGAPRKTGSGHNWRTSDGRLDIDTLRFRDRSLSSLYETLRNRRGRTIVRGELDLSSFILEGTESDGTFFHVLARTQGGEIRGLSIVYSRSARDEVGGIVNAMISSFDAFPTSTASPSMPPPPAEPASRGTDQAAEHPIAELQRQLAEATLDRLPGEADDMNSVYTNSVYTRSLVPLLRLGDLPLQTVALRVRADVRELVTKVQHSQSPAYYDSLDGFVCLVGPCSRSGRAIGGK